MWRGSYGSCRQAVWPNRDSPPRVYRTWSLPSGRFFRSADEMEPKPETLIKKWELVLIWGGLFSGLCLFGRYLDSNVTRGGCCHVRLTSSMIATTGEAIKLYRLQNNRVPRSLRRLVPNYAGSIPTDAWGRKLIYVPGMRLGSFGADGKPGGTGENADVWNTDGS